MSNQPIADVETPDPWIIAGSQAFYLTFTLGNRVEIWASQSLEDFRNARKSLVWEPRGTNWGPGIWAPELHYINGGWYIYCTSERAGEGPQSHRTLVLESRHPDPMDASGWRFLGPLRGIPDHWNIDATVFTLRNELYCCYSGWPLGDSSDKEQDLFLVRLRSPVEAVPSSLTTISKPTHFWERPDGGKRGVNEGPTFLSMPGFRGIVYSAHGSWTCDYKLGILYLVGDDPCNPSSWKKRDEPLLISQNGECGPHGPGHASFVPSPYGDGKVFCVYHGTDKQDEGWANRKARIVLLGPESFQEDAQPLCCTFTGQGAPLMLGTCPAPDRSGGNQATDLFKKLGSKLKSKIH